MRQVTSYCGRLVAGLSEDLDGASATGRAAEPGIGGDQRYVEGFDLFSTETSRAKRCAKEYLGVGRAAGDLDQLGEHVLRQRHPCCCLRLHPNWVHHTQTGFLR